MASEHKEKQERQGPLRVDEVFIDGCETNDAVMIGYALASIARQLDYLIRLMEKRDGDLVEHEDKLFGRES